MAGSNPRTRKSEPKRTKAPSAWPVFLIAHDSLVAHIEDRLRRVGLARAELVYGLVGFASRTRPAAQDA